MKTRLPVLLAAACAAPVLAADGGESTLPEMTVSQARPALVAGNPSPAAQVSAEQIRDINVINVEDALKYLPSLQIRKRYIGDRNGIIAARTSGNTQSARSLVYADGLLLSNLLGNSYGFPPRWNIVGAEEIERIDVLYGPFSALLPGNSAGATVLMTTRRPAEFEAHARVQAFSQHFALYGTDETYNGHQEQASLGGRSGKLSWSLFANHLDSHGQPMQFAAAPAAGGSGGTPVTGALGDTDPKGAPRILLGATGIDRTVQDTAKIRLAYAFTPDTRAAFTYAAWRNDSFSNTQTYLRDAAGKPVWSGAVNIAGTNYTLSPATFAPTDSNTENRLAGLTLDSRLSPDWRIELATSDYGTPTDISRTPTSAAANSQPGASGGAGKITFGDDTGWRNLDLKAVWQPAQAGHEVSFGAHRDDYRMQSRQYAASDWRSDASATGFGSRFAGKTRTDALFAQDAWTLDPRWTLTLGWRNERWQAYDGARSAAAAFRDPGGNLVTSYAYPSRDERFNSPKASLAWQASGDWLLRASLARAWRLPTVSELFQTETRGATAYISNPGLRPEKVLAKDLTAEGAAGGGSLRLSLFEEHIGDALYSQTDLSVTPNVTRVQNIEKARARGAEAAWQAADVFVRGLDLLGSLTYVDSRILANPAVPASVGKRIPRVPDWRLSAFATYHIDARWAASLGFKYSGRQYNELDNSDSQPDQYGGNSTFATLDARLSYRIAKQLSAAFGVDNLNNAKYYAYHPYPQRVIHAELRFDL